MTDMEDNQGNQTSDDKLLPELLAEKDSIDSSFVHALRLVTGEIEKIQNPHMKTEKNESGKTTRDPDFINIFANQRPKVECFLKIPVEDFPGVNFAGKILGPGGSTLKQIQEMTNTGIAILGKGSQRDPKKAEELLESGDPKWAHLKYPLHVKIRAIGPVDQCYQRIGRACTEVMQLMQVTDDMITDRGMWQGNNAREGGFQRGRGGGGNRGRGGSGFGRGGRGQSRGGRGSAAGRGAGSGRGSSNMGRGSSNMGGSGRGGRGSRGSGNQGSRGSGQGNRFNQNKNRDSYGGGGDDYGYEYNAEAGYEGYGRDDNSYSNTGAGDGYAGNGGYEEEGQEYGYGDDSYAGYDSYGGGSNQNDTSGQYSNANKSYRGKATRGRGGNRGRSFSKPY